eukprot:17873-Heterococcus_DN1.PRE.1
MAAAAVLECVVITRLQQAAAVAVMEREQQSNLVECYRKAVGASIVTSVCPSSQYSMCKNADLLSA